MMVIGNANLRYEWKAKVELRVSGYLSGNNCVKKDESISDAVVMAVIRNSLIMSHY